MIFGLTLNTPVSLDNGQTWNVYARRIDAGGGVYQLATGEIVPGANIDNVTTFDQALLPAHVIAAFN